MNFREFLADLEESEGLEGMPYDDHLGFPTIGVGCKLPLTDEECRMLAKHRAKLKHKELDQDLYDYFDMELSDLPEPAQEVLLDMSYQMGVTGALKFKNMLAAIKREDWAGAARELMDSRYARQTPNRAARNERKLLDLQEKQR